jgi:hypothetical protein
MLNSKPGLDTNPAQGAMLRMQVMALQNLGDKKSHSATESPAAFFEKFLRVLERVDAGLMGDAKQSWGAFLGGKAGDNRASTAAKPTHDAVYLNSGMADLSELFDIFDLLLLSMGDKVPGDVKTSMAAKKEEIFKKWQEAKSDPSLILDLRDKLKEIREALEKDQKQRRTALAIPHKFTVPGKSDVQKLKYWLYFLKATNGQGFFALNQQGCSLAFKIYTVENRLYPLDIVGFPKDQILLRYLGGCTYEYVGDDGLFPYLPTP